MSKSSNVNVDVNKSIAGVAALSGAISFGIAAWAFDFMHPLAAGAVAGFVGFGFGWASSKLALAAILVSAVVFLAAYSQIPEGVTRDKPLCTFADEDFSGCEIPDRGDNNPFE